MNLAEQILRATLAMKNSDSHAHYHLGMIYAAQGKTEEARNEIQARLTDTNNP